ncbi:hypothetical protein AHAS_Ahas15G0192400 [Arachis hypogaea]
MAVMTNLANIMEANAAATLQVVQRLAQPAGSRNDNGEGAEGYLRGVLRTLAAFRKADPPVFTVGEAQQWWQGERWLLHQQNMNITWALFEEAFYKKYLLEPIKGARELEFLQLKQGSMTIAEYTSKFEELCKFSRISQGTRDSLNWWTWRGLLKNMQGR